MQSLTDIHNVLAEILDTSNAILKLSVPVMRAVGDPDLSRNMAVAQLCQESDGGVQPEKALELLQEVALKLTLDAEAVRAQIDVFAKTFLQEGTSIETIEQPFFKEVWYGDTYDKEGIEGLKALKADLKKQLSKISVQGVIEVAKAQLVPDKDE